MKNSYSMSSPPGFGAERSLYQTGKFGFRQPSGTSAVASGANNWWIWKGGSAINDITIKNNSQQTHVGLMKNSLHREMTRRALAKGNMHWVPLFMPRTSGEPETKYSFTV